MKCDKWFSVFVWASHDGHKSTWKKVAEVLSEGLTHVAKIALETIYSRPNVVMLAGKGNNPPENEPSF